MKQLRLDMALGNIDFDLPSKIMMEYCHESNIACFDLTDSFKKATKISNAPLYFNCDTQWNRAGNALAGNSEANWLIELVK